MKVTIILQARTGSTRLPGKVMAELVPGRTLLSLMLERVCRSTLANEVYVATSDLPTDDCVAVEAQANGALVYRGSEEDVLGRTFECAATANADVVVRLCADSPLHDAEIIDRCIALYMTNHRKVDYVSNVMPNTFPYGTAVEVFSRDVLERLHRLTLDPALREHVTAFIHANPTLFVTSNLTNDRDLSMMRWAVDVPEDLQLAKQVYAQLYKEGRPPFSWRDALAVFERKTTQLPRPNLTNFQP